MACSALALISQLLSEALFLARQQPGALGKTAIDALAACALYRNAVLLAGADVTAESDGEEDWRPRDRPSQDTEEPPDATEPLTAGGGIASNNSRARHPDLREAEERLSENTQTSDTQGTSRSLPEKHDTVSEEVSLPVACLHCSVAARCDGQPPELYRDNCLAASERSSTCSTSMQQNWLLLASVTTAAPPIGSYPGVCSPDLARHRQCSETPPADKPSGDDDFFLAKAPPLTAHTECFLSRLACGTSKKCPDP